MLANLRPAHGKEDSHKHCTVLYCTVHSNMGPKGWGRQVRKLEDQWRHNILKFNFPSSHQSLKALPDPRTANNDGVTQWQLNDYNTVHCCSSTLQLHSAAEGSQRRQWRIVSPVSCWQAASFLATRTMHRLSILIHVYSHHVATTHVYLTFWFVRAMFKCWQRSTDRNAQFK